MSSARLLRLLSLLQTRRDWSGADSPDLIANSWPFRATIRPPVPAGSGGGPRVEPHGRIEPIDDLACGLEIGADTPESLGFP
jgi:hypothetical protein